MKILFSQHMPSNMAQYVSLQEKHKAVLDFRPFFLIEPLTSREFRTQRINLAEYTAIVFSSRHTIDAYFKLCEELRIKVPETMKYFCTTELVANYLQKHIVFRKRKIFSGNGTTESIIELIGSKHQGEKFLITASDQSNAEATGSLFEKAGLDCSKAVLVKSVSQDLHDLDMNSYDIVVLYNPNDVRSLYENFPDFKQGDIKFVSFGKSIVKAMNEAGLSIEVQAPTPEAPSAARAIELYLQQHK